MKDSKLKVLDLKTTKESIKILGINLSYNTNKCIEENFYVKIKKMKTKLNLWLLRDLTIYGKSLLAKAGFGYITASLLSRLFKRTFLLFYGKTGKTK